MRLVFLREFLRRIKVLVMNVSIERINANRVRHILQPMPWLEVYDRVFRLLARGWEGNEGGRLMK